MKLDQIKYFLETARLEHIGKAAKVLAISPSAISHSISSLEDELGQELFVKKGKRIFLTTHGKLLMKRSNDLLQHVESIKEEVSSDTVLLEGNYRLAASHVLCEKLMTPAWATLQNTNSDLEADIFTTRSSEVMKGVLDGGYDIGLCFSPQDHPELTTRVVYQGELLIYVKKTHPILKVKNLKLSDLNNYPSVLPKAFAGVEVCEAHPMFEKHNIRPKPNFRFDSYAVAAEKVESSLGWTFMPDIIPKLSSKKITALKLPKTWKAPYTISVVYSHNRYENITMKEVTKKIKEICARS